MNGHVTVEQILGDSTPTQRLRKRIIQLAKFRYSVLVSGASGTGKELVARAIHSHSPRSQRPFIPVNCAALPSSLFASQLFGHVKGAFTGAACNSMGCFRAADGGTIFLDEIGELDLELQSKLLRVLQERQVTPVGSFDSIPVDVRIVAATNRNLEEEVRTGRFRLDLFYRLNVVSIETIPLKDRPKDIAVLAQSFLNRAAVENGTEYMTLSPAALELLQAYSWPGNVRQLQNLIERAVVFAHGNTLGPECFPDVIDGLSENVPTNRLSRDEAAPLPPPLVGPARIEPSVRPLQHGMPAVNDPVPTQQTWPTLEEIERTHIHRTLKEMCFNQSAAARMLGIDRKMLARKIRKYGLNSLSPRDVSGNQKNN